jgi:putative SOS response-associated peptidase YedK
MCGRTSLFAAQEAIESRFEARFDHDYEPRYNVAPSDELAVVHDAARNTITADTWGFVPEWAESVDDGPQPINARVETVTENRLFADAFETRRALVVADGYYEWAGERGGKQPYRITVEDGPFAMAGIWSRWEGPERSLSTVAIITRPATSSLTAIHDRMPAVLPRDAETTYLQAEPSRARSLLQDRPREQFQTTPISTLVNVPSNDSPAVIEPVGGNAGQTGLDEFGH